MQIRRRLIPAKPRNKELYYDRGGSSIIGGYSDGESSGSSSSYWELVQEENIAPYILSKYPTVSQTEEGENYTQIGEARLVYDIVNNAIKFVKANGEPLNLYATGEVSAFGAGSGGSGGGGGSFVSWGDTINNLSDLTVEGITKKVALSGHTHTFTSLTDKPTTLEGYGITDGVTNTIFNNHINDNAKHLTATDRTNWNNKVNRSGDTMTGNLTAPLFIGNLRGTASTADKIHSTYGNITSVTETGTFRYGLVHSANIGNMPTSNNANGILTFNKHSGDYYSQLGFSSNGSIYHRSFNAETLSIAKAWVKLAYVTDNVASATNLSRSVVAGNGLTGGGQLNANRTLTLGTPSTIDNTSTNTVTSTSHTHNIDPSQFSVLRADGLNVPDRRNSVDRPNQIVSNRVTATFYLNASAGNPPVSTGSPYAHILNMNAWTGGNIGGGGQTQQLAFGDGLAIRQSVNETSWGAWSKLALEKDVVKRSGDTMTGGLTFTNGQVVLNQVSETAWPNSTNSNANNFINRARLSVNIGNNGLHFFGDGAGNARRFGIQSGHNSPLYTNGVYGILELNPYGGRVNVGSGGLYTVSSVSAHSFSTVPTRYVDGRKKEKVGWYRCAVGTLVGATGCSFILMIHRAYNASDNESYMFAISSVHNAEPSIVQISGKANNRLIAQIRVVQNSTDALTVDFLYNSNIANDVFVSVIGTAHAEPNLPEVTSPYGNIYTFTTVDGMKSNSNIVAVGEITAFK